MCVRCDFGDRYSQHETPIETMWWVMSSRMQMPPVNAICDYEIRRLGSPRPEYEFVDEELTPDDQNDVTVSYYPGGYTTRDVYREWEPDFPF